jgi:16S rRNA (cytidine1402-2'-O)-methyltransferase
MNLKPGLYIIATPIGNLEDITLRALETLRSVDLILCEDTRHSQKLLSHYAIKKKLWSYNDHSNESIRNKILEEINNNKSIALISDAGTPLISDPGYKLVDQLQKHNITVTTCPGSCSPIAALVISGYPTNKFSFFGFLPTQDKDREKELISAQAYSGSSIFFSTSKKLETDLKDIQNTLGDIEICIVRELTKIFEQRVVDKISNIISLHNDKPLKGEIIIIIPPQSLATDMVKIKKQVQKLQDLNFSSKDIVKIFSITHNNLSKKEIYNLTTQT